MSTTGVPNRSHPLSMFGSEAATSFMTTAELTVELELQCRRIRHAVMLLESLVAVGMVEPFLYRRPVGSSPTLPWTRRDGRHRSASGISGFNGADDEDEGSNVGLLGGGKGGREHPRGVHSGGLLHSVPTAHDRHWVRDCKQAVQLQPHSCAGCSAVRLRTVADVSAPAAHTAADEQLEHALYGADDAWPVGACGACAPTGIGDASTRPHGSSSNGCNGCRDQCACERSFEVIMYVLFSGGGRRWHPTRDSTCADATAPCSFRCCG